MSQSHLFLSVHLFQSKLNGLAKHRVNTSTWVKYLHMVLLFINSQVWIVPFTWTNLGQFVIPETCDSMLGLVNSCVYYAIQTLEIYQVLPCSVDFKAPGELWNLLSVIVLSKCSFIWNRNFINIWNDRKAHNVHVGAVNIFLIFDTGFIHFSSRLQKFTHG